MNTALEYSTRVVQEGDRRCKKSTLNDLAYLPPLRIPLMNPVIQYNVQCTPTYSPHKSHQNKLSRPWLQYHEIIHCRFVTAKNSICMQIASELLAK